MKASPLLLLESSSTESQNMLCVTFLSGIGAFFNFRRMKESACSYGISCLSNNEQLKRSGSPGLFGRGANNFSSYQINVLENIARRLGIL
jgi:hypothetical protein